MLKFEEIFRKGIPKCNSLNNNMPDQHSIQKEWQRFLEATKLFIEKTKNRKPIVDFKVRKEIIDKFRNEI